jgi:hypothetical protein
MIRQNLQILPVFLRLSSHPLPLSANPGKTDTSRIERRKSKREVLKDIVQPKKRGVVSPRADLKNINS